MILLLLDILKKFDYNINANNIKFVIRILEQEQAKEHALSQKFIKKMTEDIELKRKLEQKERHNKSTRDLDEL